jgi:DNA (cytosine-5)-methyltransferase 1
MGEIEIAGRLDIKGQDQIKRVYEVGGVSPTLSTMGGGNRQPKVIVVASRGRGEANVQHLEPRIDGLTNTITSVQKDNYVAIKTANTKGYDMATDGDGIDLNYPDSKTRRGCVGHGVSKTIPTSGGSQGVLDGFRIRKLTPKECWRLMGFDDADFDKAAKVNSNTQLYKQAGNSIVVNVLEAILEELLHGSAD